MADSNMDAAFGLKTMMRVILTHNIISPRGEIILCVLATTPRFAIRGL